MKRFIIFTLLILALAGAVDAGYLLIETAREAAVVCPNVPIGRFNLNQCNVVLATPYAKLLFLPNAFYGLAAYLIFTILVLYELNGNYKTRAIKLLSYFSGLGLIIFVYFIYLQVFVIRALCFYCLLSASIMTLIFILSATYNIKYSENSSRA